MQRREAKIGLRDRKVSPETERAERLPTKIPTETAYSDAALGFAVWVGLSGGRTRARTWDPLIKSQRIHCYSAQRRSDLHVAPGSKIQK